MKAAKCIPVLVVISILSVSGCNGPPAYSDWGESTESRAEAAETIKIASWNIENFGESKATDETRMRAIAAVLKGYDIIAVQEISKVREMSDPGCPRNEDACPGHKNCNLISNALERYLNEENGLNYRFVFSPQVKDERYLFIYNSEMITLEQCELVNDPEDSLPICARSPESTGKMVRQPFKCKFKAGDFDFVLLNVHTRYTINVQELEGLEYFFKETEKEGEPDVIVLGDLNADCTYLKPSDDISFRDEKYIWVVDDDADTAVSPSKKADCAYDRFIFKSSTAEDFTRNWGIYKNITDDISDHYLIWAEFWTGKDTD